MRNTLLAGVICALFFLFSCKKEASRRSNNIGTLLKTPAGDCMPINVAGTYTGGIRLIASNYIEVQVNYVAPGPYQANTDTVNDFYFRGEGVVDSGSHTIKLKGYGTPLLSETDIFTVRLDTSACEADVTVH